MPRNQLHDAANSGDARTIMSLASRGYDVNAQDENAANNAPLHIAAKLDHVAAIDALISIGAKLELTNQYIATPIHLAAANNRAAATARLLERGANIEAKNRHGATPLHLAAECNGVETINVLIRFGAKVNAPNAYGAPPTFCAADTNSSRAMQILLGAGANTEIVSQSGNTALLLCVERGHVECTIDLLRAGASLTATNKAGQNAMQLAEAKGVAAVTNALRTAIAFRASQAPPPRPAPVAAPVPMPVAAPSPAAPSPAVGLPLRPTEQWGDADIAQWLSMLNLGKYAKNFHENSIDGACLKMGLDDETLDAIGVALPVHRKKLQSACSELFQTGEAPPRPTSSITAVSSAAPTSVVDPAKEFQFDVFLSHDWGVDERNRDNHARVSKINDMLKARGVRTWFDNDRMVGDIVAMMCEGVERSALFVSCITQRYVAKVGSPADDNCKAEFSHAVRQRSTKNMIPVVMEERMRSTATWSGPIGMRMGDVLYVPMWDEDLKRGVDQLVGEIIKRFPGCKARIA